MPTTPLKNLLYRAALPLLAPGPGRHPPLVTRGHALFEEKAYLRLLRRHHVLGSAALLAGGEDELLLYSGSERPRRMADADTMFRVASITKMATAMVTLILADQGLLSLDVPVTEYLPPEGRVPELKGVTVRDLLSHTSGLADPPGLEAALESGNPWPVVISHQRAQAPGAGFRYSNFGYGLLGCVHESVTGEAVSRVFDRLLFQPLGMNATLDPSALPEEKILPVTRVLPWRRDQAVRKTPLGRRPLTGPDPLRHYGHTAGSLYTDLTSLHRLIRCIRGLGAPLLSERLGREMSREHASYGSLSPTLSYGLGLLIIQDPVLSSSRLLGHQGFAYGCVDGAFWEEDTGRVIIMLNGGASEARTGRLGLLNRDLLYWALRKEFPAWK